MTDKKKCPCGQDWEACIDCEQPVEHERKVIVGGQHKAAEYKHPHLNTDPLE